jgi:hypothetical protein
MEAPLRMLLVLAFGVFAPTKIAAQNVTVGDTVWYVALSFDMAFWQ